MSGVLEIVKKPTEFTMYQSVGTSEAGRRRIEVDITLVDGQMCLLIKTNSGNGVILTLKQWQQMNRSVEKMFAEANKQHDRYLMNRAER